MFNQDIISKKIFDLILSLLATIKRTMKIIFPLFLILLLIGFQLKAQDEMELTSPNGHLHLHLSIAEVVEFNVSFDTVVILENSRISMNIDNDQSLGLNPRLSKKTVTSVNNVIHPAVQEKFKNLPENYNELYLQFKDSYSIVFRAYNEGIAWRFETQFKKDITVNREFSNLVFPSNSSIWFPEEESFFSHNERYYLHEDIALISADRFCSLPALVESASGIKILVSESNLSDYPGMWLKGTGSNALRTTFPGVALMEEQTNDRNVPVTDYAPYIAITKGNRVFPWRMLAIEKEDKDLVTNSLTYLLADTCQMDDVSWIKPGKVAWDWWNAWNIYGVDFKAGVNTQTYKYYIDFASKYGIEYIIMDEGWYELGNLMKVVPEINMEELMEYGREKGVGIILWVVWRTLEDQWTKAFDQFEQWGVKGIKVDFMQRDDQWMVNYYRRVAEEAGRRKMLVDFHGAYKPSGLRRAYPNVISREGLRGLEQSKWSDKNTPDHNVTLPFIRMVAGPMDYTPGAMLNATKEHFNPVYTKPMSMGTRCHQLAMYVVYESPLQMLCDNPSNYLKEPEAMEFLSEVPTVWDSTVVLSGKISDHIVLARRSGDKWFVGCMGNWNPRDLDIDFSFLGPGNFEMRLWRDGDNADHHAQDFKTGFRTVTKNDKMTVSLAPGGGWLAIITSR